MAVGSTTSSSSSSTSTPNFTLPALSSSPLSWSWLKHHHRKQQQQQQQDCMSKSEVITGIDCSRHHHQHKETKEKLKFKAEEQVVIDLYGNDNEVEQQPSGGCCCHSMATTNQSVSSSSSCQCDSSSSVQDEGNNCCCRLGFPQANAPAAAVRLTNSRRHSRHRSSSLSGITADTTDLLKQQQQQQTRASSSTFPIATETTTTTTSATTTTSTTTTTSKTTREQHQAHHQVVEAAAAANESMATMAAINNTTNCGRWQQINGGCRSSTTGSSQTNEKHHYYQISNTSSSSNNKVIVTSNTSDNTTNSDNSNNNSYYNYISGGNIERHLAKSSSSAVVVAAAVVQTINQQSSDCLASDSAAPAPNCLNIRAALAEIETNRNKLIEQKRRASSSCASNNNNRLIKQQLNETVNDDDDDGGNHNVVNEAERQLTVNSKQYNDGSGCSATNEQHQQQVSESQLQLQSELPAEKRELSLSVSALLLTHKKSPQKNQQDNVIVEQNSNSKDLTSNRRSQLDRNKNLKEPEKTEQQEQQLEDKRRPQVSTLHTQTEAASIAQPQVTNSSSDLSCRLINGDIHSINNHRNDTYNSNSSSNCGAEVMDILRKNSIDDLVPNNHYYQEQTLINYPNNTLIVDLIKCHKNIANVWPQTELDSSLAAGLKSVCCWRPRERRHYALQSSHRVDSGGGGGIGIKKFKGCNRLNFQMPEPLARTNLRLKSDVYDKALSVLTNDIRYQLHLLLYRRIQIIWLLLSSVFCIVIPIILMANVELLIVLGSFCLWLSLQLLGAFITKQFRIKLDEMLEKSVAQVNSFFMEHNLMLGVINVGSLTRKAKLNIPMVYFDTSQCREQIESIISINEGNRRGKDEADEKRRRRKLNDDCSSQNGDTSSSSSTDSSSSSSSNSSDIINNKNNGDNNFFLDYSKLSDQHEIYRNLQQQQQQQLQYQATPITPTRPQNVAFAMAQTQMAKKILLRYSQRWISQYDKRKLMFADDNNLEPRHLSTGKCLCQFIEEQLIGTNKNKTTTTNVTTTKETSAAAATTSGSAEAAQDSPSQRRRRQRKQQQISAKFERCNELSSSSDAAANKCKVVINMGDEGEGGEIKSRRLLSSQSPSPSRPIIPTLSHLVSLREDNHQNAIGTSITASSLNHQNDASISSIATTTDGGDSQDPSSEIDLQSTTRDISLELGNDSIGRSDDLVQRLRLLLELRKNDLQGIDGGSLFADIQSKTPQFLSTFNNDHIANSTGYTTADSLTIDSTSHDPPSPRTPPPVVDANNNNNNNNDNHHHQHHHHKSSPLSKGGKKIFRQRDGLFLLGMIGAKKNQSPQNHQQPKDRILEIC